MVHCAVAGETEAEIREEVGKLRAREIKRELEAAGVNAADAFEKDELIERLVAARLHGPPTPEEAGAGAETPPPAAGHAASAPTAAVDDTPKRETEKRCRAMSVKELRTELGSRGIAWADALEKEELVQRLSGVLAHEASFSCSGRLRPGAASELTAAELEQELCESDTPLLLDVYATWCGPCQLMAPQLEAAAQRLGARARVAKLDSDKHTAMASRLRVGGLPTIILFNRQGKEVARQEGALMEQQLINMVQTVGA